MARRGRRGGRSRGRISLPDTAASPEFRFGGSGRSGGAGSGGSWEPEARSVGKRYTRRSRRQ